jgi:phytoene synthase
MDTHIQDAKLILKKNGKSFNWAGKFLPNKYINRAAELYSFCRILDDIADSGDTFSLEQLKGIKSYLLQNKKKSLSEINYPKYFNIISKKAAIDLIDGLILDQNSVSFDNQSELIRYSYQVAGTVGLMMCDALECRDKNANLFAIDLGIAMQLTNIARDVLEDASMGRRYLPGPWVDNLSAKEITKAAEKGDEKKIKIVSLGIEKLLNLSEKYYLSGSQGLVYLPLRTRVAISIAGGVYREIGIQLKNKNYNWHMGRQVTSNITKAKISVKKILTEISKKKIYINHKSELHKYLKGFYPIEV